MNRESLAVELPDGDCHGREADADKATADTQETDDKLRTITP